MKTTLDDKLQALLLLISLLDSWETLMISLSNLAHDDIVTMDIVTSTLLNEEVRRKSRVCPLSMHWLLKSRGGI